MAQMHDTFKQALVGENTVEISALFIKWYESLELNWNLLTWTGFLGTVDNWIYVTLIY